MTQHTKILIVGGGIIGCSIAYELAKKGVQATILDKGMFNEEASTAAAGMLGAHVETSQPGAFFDLCKSSFKLYHDWTEELFELTQISAQYIAQGIVRVALTEDDEIELKQRLPWLGSQFKWLSQEDIAELEPAITKNARGGLFFDQDHQVHPIHLAKALRNAVIKMGCEIKEMTPVLSLLTRENQVIGVNTNQGEIFADHTIITSGAWSPSLLTPLGISLPITPIKGQCISVRMENPFIQKTVFTHGCYVVPKMDGSYLIGATQENVGYNKKTTAQAIADINKAAIKLLPDLEHAEFISTWAGLRPSTKDGLPFLGAPANTSGLIIASGHFRNGILLAPITGKLISQLVCDESLSVDIQPFSPNRHITV